MPGRFVGQVRMSKKCGQLLDANVVAINRVLSPRRDLANDGGGVARLRWMILWLLWATYPVLKLSKRQPLEFWELLLYIYVTCYIGPVLLVAADLTIYGGRMVIAIALRRQITLGNCSIDRGIRPVDVVRIVCDEIRRRFELRPYWLGKLVESDRTNKVFTAPSQKLTEDYVTGRFG